MELDLESEKKNHAETIKILRKKERQVKEIVIQCEEDQRNVLLLQEALDKANSRLAQYKRQLNEQVRKQLSMIKIVHFLKQYFVLFLNFNF
jgi:vacuolar-type H+-ATPase subunit H